MSVPWNLAFPTMKGEPISLFYHYKPLDTEGSGTPQNFQILTWIIIVTNGNSVFAIVLYNSILINLCSKCNY